MAWTLFVVPSSRRGDLDAVLKDDLLSRQSQTLRDAKAMGGPADAIYVLIEGSAEAVALADQLLGPLGTKPADAPAVHTRFVEEQESASAGMGLFFTEG